MDKESWNLLENSLRGVHLYLQSPISDEICSLRYSTALQLFSEIVRFSAVQSKGENGIRHLEPFPWRDIVKNLKMYSDTQSLALSDGIASSIMNQLMYASIDDKLLWEYLMAFLLSMKVDEKDFLMQTDTRSSTLLVRDIRKLPNHMQSYLIRAIAESARHPMLLRIHYCGVLRVSALLLTATRIESKPEARSHFKIILTNIHSMSFEVLTYSQTLHILVWIERICVNRWDLLDVKLIGSIWNIISNALQESGQHMEVTSGRIYELILNIMRNLIHLRRDLVLATLPHVVNITMQLFKLLALPRFDLGKRQINHIGANLPLWVNPSVPLGEKEARAFSRYLMAFNTKTVPWSGVPNDKAESLARPMSIHAPLILLGYIKLALDPLLIIPSIIRRELEPGLVMLCEISSIHARDAMMSELTDAGEKAMFKRIWQEYEQQRYVGQG